MEVSAKIGSNRTLSYAQKYGMKLEFISRAEYKLKTEKSYLASLESKYPNYYIIPEGGTNRLAVKGCEEILADEDRQYDVICCAVGTGGTLSGIINSSLPHQKIIGFPALKGAFLKQDICKFAKQSNWDLCQDYHFGGYAKVHLNLIEFINCFKREFKIPLDPIYTGKMLFGVFDMMDKGMFSKSQKVLAIHTGGLQGIEGMNQKLGKNNLDLMV
jgi:1-aminocyclopropane-1-carboxylate deaminase